MKHILFIFLITLGYCSLSAQPLTKQVKIDSLLAELPKAKEDTNKVNLLRAIAFEYISTNPNAGLEYGNGSLALAQQIDWKIGVGKANTAIGAAYRARGEYKQALIHYKAAVEIFEQLNETCFLGIPLFGMFWTYYITDPSQALDYVLKSLAIHDTCNDMRGMAIAYQGIGGFKLKHSDYQGALEAFLTAEVLFEQLGTPSTTNISNIALVYESLGEYDKALYYNKQAYASTKGLENLSEAIILLNLGGLFDKLQEFDSAFAYLEASYAISIAKGFNEVTLDNLFNLAMVSANSGNHEEALPYFITALAMADTLGRPYTKVLSKYNLGIVYHKEFHRIAESTLQEVDIDSTYLHKSLIYLEEAYMEAMPLGFTEIVLQALRELQKYYVCERNFEKALETQTRYRDLKDSIFSVEKTTAIANLEAKRENELKDKEIALLAKEAEINRLELERSYTRLRLNELESYRQHQSMELLTKDIEIKQLHISQNEEELLKKQLEYEAQASRLEAAELEKMVKDAELSRQKALRLNMLAGFGVLLLAGSGFTGFVLYRRKSRFREKVALTELKALRAQMNPHFVFNALGSIHNFVMQNDNGQASEYLLKFSRLMRLILNSSLKETIPLNDELEGLEIYMQLEAARMEHQFTYDIAVAEDIDTDFTLVPPLLIQPFVENAIWHGLSHKGTPGYVLVRIKRKGNKLHCTIEDNGIGRKRSMELYGAQAAKKESVGIKLTQERIDIINRQKKTDGGVSFTDLLEGLRVEIDLPIEESFT